MEGAEAFLEISGRAVQHADLFQGQPKRLGRDLRADGFQSLPDVGRADIDRGAAVTVELDARVLARAGGAALDEAHDRRAVVAPVDQLAVQLRLFRPAEFADA